MYQQLNDPDYCAFMYSFYDRLMQQPNQSAACKAFRLERQQHYADRYCQLTAHLSPMPAQS